MTAHDRVDGLNAAPRSDAVDQSLPLSLPVSKLLQGRLIGQGEMQEICLVSPEEGRQSQQAKPDLSGPTESSLGSSEPGVRRVGRP